MQHIMDIVEEHLKTIVARDLSINPAVDYILTISIQHKNKQYLFPKEIFKKYLNCIHMIEGLQDHLRSSDCIILSKFYIIFDNKRKELRQAILSTCTADTQEDLNFVFESLIIEYYQKGL